MGFSVVTFAGGDPFDYKEFRALLIEAHELGLEIHIDTNGISLERKDYNLLNKYVSLIGLPIDGPDSETHDNLRTQKGHYSRVISHLKNLQDQKIRIKINTVVTAINISYIPLIYHLIARYRIQIWSIFQFMPLAGGAKLKEKYAIDDDAFEETVKKVISANAPFLIEIGRAKERQHSYLFVSLDGQAYTHSKSGPLEYLNIGNFLSNEWEEKFWTMNNTTIKEGARIRYYALK